MPIQWACSFVLQSCHLSVLTPAPPFKGTMQYCQCLLIVLLMSPRHRVDLACEIQCGPFCTWTPQISVMVSAESHLLFLTSCCCTCVILQDPWFHLPAIKRRNWISLESHWGRTKISPSCLSRSRLLFNLKLSPHTIHFYPSCEKSHWNVPNSVLETWGEMPQVTSSLWLLVSC